ncbi:Rho GDP exchange inhibitor, putative [Entamoeba histolytica HM-1:IMSS-B]|uniref:Rho GDP exchange inhibitor, putative n=10 Tax=Entamoeba TaxID=5758 RepID=C4M6L6_ENTH1|nr:Rho GDP-dissociation inhibitor, putative [Entamoeba dispar SAW760]XP_001738850.1 Rho GDP-dissociation inhibitor, putative [Entamoeba dispar SAW760]XP_008856196.1 Rho GDP exchange inhibitor, putative [Entamoeba nuttalli P19]XP_654522.1 Rho GDP exchange inhibitor, putative [Entamoeba histolytica HM-1:IMSS]EMD42651.1 Rho GDP-dissociation inhibitor, putative [Entamoeba histolytica KU27]EMH76511.1 Rho GDP exchange inhibitor, putative [Entamoeba histolytica HM-1:IMSS-B]EMS10927.1 Rho GDP-dissoci|eukprot:EDR24796.1 Rho GDP-dissociation inhibitor, putative [Entamoeba dispar SAW760]
MSAADIVKNEKDPSLVAYLKSLGIDPDYVPPKDDPRRVVISEFAVLFKEHDPVILKLNTEEDMEKAKKTPIIIKEGAEFKMRVTFRVQHQPVLGLRILNTVSKLGKQVASDEEMLGSYPPKNEFNALELPKNDWNEAPTGMLARGEYKSNVKFYDDDKVTHLQFDYLIKIAKDWD